ncbi:MAG: hypothetical protein ACP5MZ_00350 [Candidatus Micrarchaeia archaeon]
MNTEESIPKATTLSRLKGYIRTAKDSADFYEKAREEVWNECNKGPVSKFFSMPFWKYNDLLYDGYKRLIPFWRQALGDEVATHAVKLLVLYADYLVGPLVYLVDIHASIGDTKGIEDLYSRYYKPNAASKEKRAAIRDIKAEAGIGLRRY